MTAIFQEFILNMNCPKQNSWNFEFENSLNIGILVYILFTVMSEYKFGKI